MIEQTELIVTEWNYHLPASLDETRDKILNFTTLDVMKKRASTKKGIAYRFTSHFTCNDTNILVYVAEDSYVIDFADVIDKNELLVMIRNSYSKFKSKFDFRKLGTILQSTVLPSLEETNIDLDKIIPLLI